ncbi:MAG: hypothetical protein K1X72_21480 [Pyrinomonadaceae bacterium]|nr:hypothetical protein [Pyrinomonadaceae bacterium]
MNENLKEIEEQVRQESVKLLQYIERRDKVLGILKYAPVSQRENIYQAINKLDKVIEDTEDILEILKKKYLRTLEIMESDNKLAETMDKIIPDLLRSFET